MASNSILDGKFVSSVPIAVYRELATELKLTQAQLAFYRTRYEQAHQQNQQIVQEAHQVLSASQKIQLIVTTTPSPEKIIPQVSVPAQILEPPTETEVKFHWLVITMSIVLVSSFGLGFMVMNTLSAQKNRRA